MAPNKSNESIAFADVVVNAQVIHPTFGPGKVLSRTGEDDNSKAIIKFKEEGEKKIALKYANLLVEKPEEDPAAEEEAFEADPVFPAKKFAALPELEDEEEDIIEEDENLVSLEELEEEEDEEDAEEEEEE
jgi:hypothetical protein